MLLTSVGQRGDSRKALDSGFNAYLTKPMHPEDLHDAITLLCSPDLHIGEQLITRHSIAEMRGHISTRSRHRLAINAMAVIPQGPRVLVVEDNAASCTIVCRTLERLGCHVTIATSGTEAVATCLSNPFDLVFMDYHLPEMDGVQATRIIRDRLKDKHVPILAMSASVLDADRKLFGEAGMDGIITKPIRLEDIERAITRYVLNTDGSSGSRLSLQQPPG
jgi:CheY-like chemotaxis protein